MDSFLLRQAASSAGWNCDGALAELAASCGVYLGVKSMHFSASGEVATATDSEGSP